MIDNEIHANVLHRSEVQHIARGAQVVDRPVSEQGGTLVGRRSVLMVALAAGVLAPFVGTGTAKAADEDEYPIPEECGSIPWW